MPWLKKFKPLNQTTLGLCHDTFVFMAKLVTVCFVLCVAAIRNWSLHQLDVNKYFLQGDLNEKVYMKLPLGFSCKGETHVCKLNKFIHGLKTCFSSMVFQILNHSYL